MNTIELSEIGAVLTIQVNPRFAERLLRHIESLEARFKSEGDNQILAGLLNQALSLATRRPRDASGLHGPLRGKKAKKKLKDCREAVAFWQKLQDEIAAEDGSAITTINAKIAHHEATSTCGKIVVIPH